MALRSALRIAADRQSASQDRNKTSLANEGTARSGWTAAIQPDQEANLIASRNTERFLLFVMNVVGWGNKTCPAGNSMPTTRTMTSPKIERRLAAIMVADVAGYSRLMGTDEVGALNALKEHRRDRIDPTIARHNGRIFKATGDGLLVELPSINNSSGFHQAMAWPVGFCTRKKAW